MNKIIYWLVILTALASCFPVREYIDSEPSEDFYPEPGGVYTEHDTVIGSDTLYYWVKTR